MEKRHGGWERIEITHEDGFHTVLHRGDLDDIDAISDVLDALQRAKKLTASLRDILGE